VEITEVRIKLMDDSEDRLRAFCSITFDNCFVVRDLKIIEGANGPFVAMPSRKLTARCGRCGCKNHLRSQYCNQCGAKQRPGTVIHDEDSPNKLYADIAHPINQVCRDMIQVAVIRGYEQELQRAQQPGYVSRYDDEYNDSNATAIDGTQPPKPHFDARSNAAPKEPTSKDGGSKNEGRDGFGAGLLES
jgi:stage V sporulation protein G